jgi:iron complex outermembrane recepter protein
VKKLSCFDAVFSVHRLGLLLLLAASEIARAEDIFNLSLEELMNISVKPVAVTAEHQLADLQTVPLAITALDMKALHYGDVRSLRALENTIAPLSVTQFNAAEPQIYIRGIGSNLSGAGDESSVAVFFDDIYLSRPSLHSGAFLDLERVEVLRGAQSALWGKSVIGGAIQLVPIKPQAQDSQQLSLDLNRFNGRSLNYVTNHQLDNGWRRRTALAYSYGDEVVSNEATAKELHEGETFHWRDQLAQEFEHISVRALIDLQRRRGGDATPLRTAGEPVPFAELLPQTPSDQVWLPLQGESNQSSILASLHLEQQLGRWAWTNITAYEAGSHSSLDAQLPSRSILVSNEVGEEFVQFSNELRVSGSIDSAEWLLGSYLSSGNLERSETYDLRGFLQLFGAELSPELPGLADYWAEVDNKSASMFGQWRQTIQERSHLTLGLRTGWVEKGAYLLAQGGDPWGLTLANGSGYQVREKASWMLPNWRLVYDFAFTPDIFSYISFSSGSKGGSFNSVAISEVLARTASEAERAKTRELGLKSEWLNQRLRLNLALFETDYQGLQVHSPINAVSSAIPEAQQQGLELELTATPVKGLELGASYALLNAEYEKFTDAGVDVAGNRMTHAPKHTFSWHGQYTQPLANGSYLSWRLDGNYRSPMDFSLRNLPSARAEAYHLVHAGVYWQSRDRSLESWLRVKNLTNIRYNLWQQGIGQYFGTTSTRQFVPAPGRNLVLGLGWRW